MDFDRKSTFSSYEQLCESLADRISIIELGSLNASEVNASQLIKANVNLLWKGGYPEIWAEDLLADFFFRDYINSYLERDLKDFMNIYKLQGFRSFLSLLSLRAAKLLNFRELSKKAGVSESTVKSWITALQATGIIALLPPYFENLGKRVIKGGLKEGRDLFFFRDSNGVEIDFIIHKDHSIHLVEAKYSELPDPKKQNFGKLTHLFNQEVNAVLAYGINDPNFIKLKNHSLYNPLYGHSWFKLQA